MDSVLPGVASANANMSNCQLFSASCHTCRLALLTALDVQKRQGPDRKTSMLQAAEMQALGQRVVDVWHSRRRSKQSSATSISRYGDLPAVSAVET